MSSDLDKVNILECKYCEAEEKNLGYITLTVREYCKALSDGEAQIQVCLGGGLGLRFYYKGKAIRITDEEDL